MLLRSARGPLPKDEIMKLRQTLPWSFAGLLAAAVLMTPLMTANPALSAAPPASTFHRVELKPAKGGAALPFTLEVPADWQVLPVAQGPGLWIGPADAKPPEDPRLIRVRGSQVSLADPAAIVANIKANDLNHPEWSAPRVEVKTVGGLKCVLVEMETGEGDKARTSLTLKVPLETLSVDLVGSATRAEFPRMLPLYERILSSVQPVTAGTK
jgi:hypothetical protein